MNFEIYKLYYIKHIYYKSILCMFSEYRIVNIGDIVKQVSSQHTFNDTESLNCISFE